MKRATIFVPILLMTALNWVSTTIHVSTGGTSTITRTIASSGLAALIGIGLCAFLIRAVYLRIRDILDRGIVFHPRFRIPASASLMPLPRYFLLAALLTIGFTYSNHGTDAAGTFTSKLAYGVQASTAPFWLAVLAIFLWNILCALSASLSHRIAESEQGDFRTT